MTFPKIEFVLNEELRREKEIVWKSGSRTLRWSVDAGYLDRARQVIAVTERLPDTSLMTGIHQAPYRVVKIKPHS
jgi:L-alanine-DL-glutamate epimerase-like enolase superfamily enzyme